GSCQGTYVTEQTMSHAIATTNGYTSSQLFAYSPVSATAPTVGTGTNRQSYCNALSSAGLTDAATACQSDTGYACSYNTSDHTMNCPTRSATARPTGAWD